MKIRILAIALFFSIAATAQSGGTQAAHKEAVQNGNTLVKPAVVAVTESVAAPVAGHVFRFIAWVLSW